MCGAVPEVGRVPADAARGFVPVEEHAGDGEHVVALALRPIEERRAVGIRPVRREEAVAAMEAADQRVPPAFETEPHRVLIIRADQARQIAVHALERIRLAAAAVGKTGRVTPCSNLIRHEADAPRVAAFVEAPEVDRARVRLRVGDVQRHVAIRIGVGVGVAEGSLEAVPLGHGIGGRICGVREHQQKGQAKENLQFRQFHSSQSLDGPTVNEPAGQRQISCAT